MAPAMDLFARDSICGYGYYYDGFGCRRRSGWYFWGRWVLAGIAIVLALIFLASCLCITRRNRRRGVQPLYGTGWLGGNTRPSGNNKPNNGHEMNNYQSGSGYNNQGGGYNQGDYSQQQSPYNQGGYGYTAPPPYGQPPVGNQTTGTTFNANDGYVTSQPQYAVQPPQSAYQPDAHYQPPAGPPPGK